MSAPMNLLVDTHVLLWSAAEPDRLSVGAKHAIADPSVRFHVSLVSLWTIRVKQSIGRLDERLNIHAMVAGLAASVLDIRRSHIDMVTRLPLHHRDPFDRLLVAQALVERMSLMSADRIVARYPVNLIW